MMEINDARLALGLAKVLLTHPDLYICSRHGDPPEGFPYIGPFAKDALEVNLANIIKDNLESVLPKKDSLLVREHRTLTTESQGEVKESNYVCRSSLHHTFSVLTRHDLSVGDFLIDGKDDTLLECLIQGCYSIADLLGENPAEATKEPTDPPD